MIGIIDKILDPPILICFGWKRRCEAHAGGHRILWKNPKNGHWNVQSIAVAICEKQIQDRKAEGIAMKTAGHNARQIEYLEGHLAKAEAEMKKHLKLALAQIDLQDALEKKVAEIKARKEA